MKGTIAFAALAALVTTGDALALGGIAQVSIIDRQSGAELVPHFYHGEYWVAGTPGATYAIEIRNRLSERILAVTSVDGVNVISGATAGWDQTGYVFDPGQAYQISGWRKSDAEVAAFTFTAAPSSYAERTGRPANVGVIGIALFRERPPAEVYVPPSQPIPDPLAGSGAPKPRAPEAPVPAAPDTAATDSAKSASGSRERSDRAAAAPPASYARPEPKLGTGHGERESSYVSHTDFSRLQPQPNEVIRIRYDSLANLVAMGIMERPQRIVPIAGNPFPASAQQQYVPDPDPR
jgi:hypothetical protein